MSARWPTRLAGLVALLIAVPAGAPDARAVGEELSGWTASASASAVTAFPAIPTLIPYDAPVEATASLTVATLSTGGLGFGRASTLWPGVFAGLGPLMKQVAPDAPEIPAYPLVLERREFEEPGRTEQGGTVMSADVTPERAVVEAVTNTQAIDGVVDVGASRTISTATANASSVATESTARVNDVVLAGGAITIDSVVTHSKATSDGAAATCDGTTIVSGLVIGGTPAVIDDEGVHAADANDAIDAVLAATGVKLRLLGGIGSCDGSSGGWSTGGLLVSIPIPAAGPVPPGGTLNVILASSAVTADAVRGAPLSSGIPLPRNELRTPLTTPLPSAAPVSAAPTVTPAASPSPTVVTAPIATAEPISYRYDGIPRTTVVGALLLAIPATTRLRRYVDRLHRMARSAS